ncbi:MAG: hypothetical protein ACXQS2_01805 [Methermicoccaceae archaeon]
MFTKTEIELAPKVYEAIRKIAKAKGKKWEWKPEIGDWFLLDDYPYVVAGVLWYTIEDKVVDEPQPDDAISIVYVKSHTIQTEAHDNVIPLLHWEKLEKIMEKFGYFLDLDYDYHTPFCCEIWDSKQNLPVAFGYENTRQEAVMQAIIELSEKIDKEVK